MIRTIRDKPEPFTHKDFPNVCDALHLAVRLLEKHGDQEGVEQVAAVAEGRAKLVVEPGDHRSTHGRFTQ